MIKGLSSAERLSIKSSDLRKVMRRRAMFKLFDDAIAQHRSPTTKAARGSNSNNNRRPNSRSGISSIAVSYTHLTLPTIYSV